VSLQDRVNAALAERLDADARRARADRLLAAVIGEAERLRAEGAPVRELSSDQRIGTIRLDGADLPAAPVIEKLDELASWLAEHAPDLVTATIRVPVEKLAEALEALGYAGLGEGETSAAVAPRDLGETLAWLARECLVQTDPQIPRAWNVMHKDEEGHLSEVPGTTARPPVGTWKVIVDKDKKRDAIAVAVAEADDLVAALNEPPGHEEWCVDAEHDPAATSCYPAAMDAEGRPADETAPSAPVETLAEQLERRMRAGDPEAAAAHAIIIQGGYSTPEIEAERMHADGIRSPQIDRFRTAAPDAPTPDKVAATMPKTILVARARELGLPLTGTKAELAARINNPDAHAAAVAAVDSTEED
jgi:hypothetical protein